MDRSPRGRSMDDDRRGRDGGSTRIYVGNLPSDCQRTDIEDLFGKYGRIVDISVKRTISGAPFAFIEYEDVRDADHAIRGRDGYEMMGSRLRVEVPFAARGGGRPKGKGTGPPRRGDYRVQVSGLPPSGSWQDLKDHMRTAGECVYAEVFRDGSGIVEFVHRDDMEYAVKNLNGAKFKSHEGEVSRIQVSRADRGGDGRRSFERRSYDRRSYERRSYDRRSSDRRSSSHTPEDRDGQRAGGDRDGLQQQPRSAAKKATHTHTRSASRSNEAGGRRSADRTHNESRAKSRSFSPRRHEKEKRRSSPSNDSHSYRSYSKSRSRSRDRRPGS